MHISTNNHAVRIYNHGNLKNKENKIRIFNNYNSDGDARSEDKNISIYVNNSSEINNGNSFYKRTVLEERSEIKYKTSVETIANKTTVSFFADPEKQIQSTSGITIRNFSSCINIPLYYTPNDNYNFHSYGEYVQMQHIEMRKNNNIFIKSNASASAYAIESQNGNLRKKEKKVEFSKTEVHFPANSNKFYIIESKEKVPNKNFRENARRNRLLKKLAYASTQNNNVGKNKDEHIIDIKKDSEENTSKDIKTYTFGSEVNTVSLSNDRKNYTNNTLTNEKFSTTLNKFSTENGSSSKSLSNGKFTTNNSEGISEKVSAILNRFDSNNLSPKTSLKNEKLSTTNTVNIGKLSTILNNTGNVSSTNKTLSNGKFPTNNLVTNEKVSTIKIGTVNLSPRNSLSNGKFSTNNSVRDETVSSIKIGTENLSSHNSLSNGKFSTNNSVRNEKVSTIKFGSENLSPRNSFSSNNKFSTQNSKGDVKLSFITTSANKTTNNSLSNGKSSMSYSFGNNKTLTNEKCSTMNTNKTFSPRSNSFNNDKYSSKISCRINLKENNRKTENNTVPIKKSEDSLQAPRLIMELLK